VGALVAADVVMARDAAARDRAEVEKKLTAYCLEQELEEWMVPRFWNFLSQIPMGGNFKAARRG
jgi:hypothetical protein